ncbi:MAG: sulfite exporter TauE/SafE family protein [Candidatus Cloacimonetes bacterium]|nr:sulfite exporter TauE/SafE family protein [Candidatus Cloacimonadota bacterium]
MFLILFCISLLGGFLSGLLGIGGAVILIPLMLTLPQLFGIGALSMKSVAGLSMVQVLFASISGMAVHRKNRMVHFQSQYTIGIPMGLFSLSGAYLSKFMSNYLIMIIFFLIVLLALFMLILYKDDRREEIPDKIRVNSPLALAAGVFTGTFSGIVGAGGGFILIPIMITVLKLPVRLAVGTSLGVVFIGALLGSIGKIVSLQVDFLLVIPVIIGSLAAAQIGARVSRKLTTKMLRVLLIITIILTLLQVISKLVGLS